MHYFNEISKILAELGYYDSRNLIFITVPKSPNDINDDAYIQIKKIEEITKHDVTAINQYIKIYAKELFDVSEQQLNFVHMALTSNDLNSPAYMKKFINGLNEVMNEFNKYIVEYEKFIVRTKDIIIMSRTHGQPAVPTDFAKELYVHFDIILKNYNELQIFINDKNNIECKFGGAVNNLNAHLLINKNYDWIAFADKFIDSFGMKRSKYATQIDHYETISKILSMIVFATDY